MEYLLYQLHHLQLRLLKALKSIEFFGGPDSSKQKVLELFTQIRSIGYEESMDDYEKRKLEIFNQLNFFQLITGIVVPIIALVSSKKFPVGEWYIVTLPALISILVLVLNAIYKHEAALLCYFIFYPVFTCIIYINGLNLGIELSFVLYGILSVFFLQDIGYMLFAVSLSMISYFILSVAWKDYRYQLEVYNFVGYLVNQLLAIIYIFYGLYLIKRENTEYQLKIVTKNTELHKKNLEIGNQKQEIVVKATLLEKQAAELRELNSVKNKLFSIISHDLKSPMYAMRNLFRSVVQLNLSAKEVKAMLPEVVKDLNYTTELMENLLQWAKFQMQSNNIYPQKLDVNNTVNEVVQLLHLQSDAKKITVERKTDLTAQVWVDKDIVNLVLRNLISNAIKFTPERGRIIIGTHQSACFAEIYVKDSGMGISKEDMAKINSNSFYSSNGTNSETGTGLGLMLCKEYLAKSNGYLMIESHPGVGSTFSFTLPLAK
jgi:two-component system, sensor histidine kinase and response regulator